MNQVLFNGKFYPGGSALVPADNRGLRFGDGIFETFTSMDGRPRFFDEHMARLWQGLHTLQFAIPKQFTPGLLLQQTGRLLQKNGHASQARIRLTVFAGDGGLYDDAERRPNYLLQSWALPAETGQWNSNGLVLGIYREIQKQFDILSSLKHNNFLPYVLAARQAKKEKWNDAIILNTHGRICDTTIANIFLIKNGVWYTPALQEACIAGITRGHIISSLLQAGQQVHEGPVTVEQLLQADEVFVCNSVYNIRWVGSIGERRYTCRETQKLHAALFVNK